MSYEPDPRIKGYLDEINQAGIPYVSTSHCTLHRISCEHGHKLISDLLDHHFKMVRFVKANQHKPWDTYRTTNNRGRVSYHPEWDAEHPWCIYVGGTAGCHVKDLLAARIYFSNRFGWSLKTNIQS